MATYNKFHNFVQDLAHKVHNLSTDQLKVALTNTAPVASNSVLANLTGVLGTTNLLGATPFNITTVSAVQTNGIFELVVDDLLLTASGGSVGPFQYVVLYNDTAVNDPLIGWWVYTSPVTLANGETFLIDVGANILTLG